MLGRAVNAAVLVLGNFTKPLDRAHSMGDRLTPTGCLSILHLDLNEIDRGANRLVPRDRLLCRDLWFGLLWNCGRVRSLFLAWRTGSPYEARNGPNELPSSQPGRRW